VDTSADQNDASAKLDPVTRFDVAILPLKLDLYIISFTFTHAPVYRIKDQQRSKKWNNSVEVLEAIATTTADMCESHAKRQRSLILPRTTVLSTYRMHHDHLMYMNIRPGRVAHLRWTTRESASEKPLLNVDMCHVLSARVICRSQVGESRQRHKESPRLIKRETHRSKGIAWILNKPA
jgi:hypothetical protein